MELNRRLFVAWFSIAAPIVVVVVIGGIAQQRQSQDLNRAYLSAEVQRIAGQQQAVLRQVEHALGVVARSIDLTDAAACQRDVVEAHVIVEGYVTGVLAIRADGFVSCALPTHVIGRQFEPETIVTVAESLRTGQAAFGLLTQGHVTGRPIITVAYPIPARNGSQVGSITSGVLVSKLAELTQDWRGPSSPEFSWIEAGGGVHPLGHATGLSAAYVAQAMTAADGTVSTVSSGLLAVADVTENIRLVARVRGDELATATVRQVVVPAVAVLLLLLAGLALGLMALKRWIIEPVRELDRSILADAARVAVGGGSVTEWEALRSRLSARDEAWAEAVKLRDILVNEVNHRVANTLQMVVSLLRLHDAALARGTPAQASEILRQAQDRIATIAVVHRQLRAAASGGVHDLHHLLWSIADTLVAGFGMSDRVSVEVDVAPAPLRAEEAVALGLLLNEWVTNSLKYAYPDGRAGVIRIEVRLDGPDMVLHYTDGGVGSGPERRDGLGTAITAGLTKQLQGELERVRGGGETYRLRFPMPA